MNSATLIDHALASLDAMTPPATKVKPAPVKAPKAAPKKAEPKAKKTPAPKPEKAPKPAKAAPAKKAPNKPAGNTYANMATNNSGASTVDHPVKVVWDLCDKMKDSRRKDVIAKAVEMGVGYYTARTQYQLWLTAYRNS